ncbi:hypothetical protein [Paraburkholderia hospita]|jgi:hypothetical protein|uniref:SnoaL-like domain-containing protein n=1 Tax=Paraburkholderia hospita TaxID=169430 RepID=A0AAJ4SVY7_9BURK|nr:hypothetical protein [Paraburkholderia hospita]EUC20423.1 hypothetical protein PMI06_001448 [Burkholderia sp. BT03]SKC96105.1 hypothetical protein SAMN05445504_6830 [Burkholderia sp. CF099]AUT75057.1 hypothetical protein C2L64_43580 [Paraburkholderia hospita]AXF04682.1 hypothetical protein CUJ88_40580 [Paraburkholderia hospita]EIM93292.1 hypothetical protein WQE_50980 [Paraburkholderia hospita]
MRDRANRIRKTAQQDARVIASFLLALNNADAGAMAALFRDDALVNDQLRDFWGRPAIEAWIAREVIADNLRIEVLQMSQHYRVTTVVGAVTGTFDSRGLPNPLVVNLHFSLFNGQIARLFMLLNRQVDTFPDVRCRTLKAI